VPESLDRISAEMEGLKQRSDERMENINARIVSLHDSIGVLRQRAEENATNIRTIDTKMEAIRDDIADVHQDFDEVSKRFEKQLEDMKNDWSEWLESLGSRLKWIAAFLAPLILGILALVLK
jgi:septation ring formation regulator EzrA